MSNLSSQLPDLIITQDNYPNDNLVSRDRENEQLLYISELISEIAEDCKSGREINAKRIKELLDRLF